MSDSRQSPPERHPAGPDVYRGLDALCAAMGASLALVGLVTVIVAGRGLGDESLAEGAVMAAIGAGLLGIGKLFNVRGSNGRHH